jgi:type 1 fimbriae regulatory protein FimB
MLKSVKLSGLVSAERNVPTTRPTGVRYLTKEEVERFFATIAKENLRDRLLFDLIYRHGLRRREVALISIDDISLRDGSIWISRVKQGIPGAYQLHPQTLALLRAYLPTRDAGAARFLFQSTRRPGAAISPSLIYYLFRRYATAANLPEGRRHVHVFRHSIAVHFMNEGVDSADVKDWLGHRSISSTMIYAQVTNKRRDATYQRVRSSKEIART